MTPQNVSDEIESISGDGLVVRPETYIRIRWVDDFIRDWQDEAFARWLREHGS